MGTRLGVDLGTNSIGWSFLETDGQKPKSVIKTGVRIFSDGRDPQKGDPLAVERRIARGARRRRDRMLRRKSDLREFLMALGLFPQDIAAQHDLKKLNPYELRVRGLTEELKPFELGRALIHLSQRRGFKSNRKSEKKEDKDEKNDREALDKALRDSEGNYRHTLAEYLNKRLVEGKGTRARAGEGLTTLRDHYRYEFERLREAQKKYHGLSDDDWGKIEHILFFQRDLLPPQLGYCQIYYVDKLERAYRAMPSFQRFRIEQNLSHLQINKVPLTPDQRNKLRKKLKSQKTLGFSKIRTLLGLDEAAIFNLETDQRRGLEGDTSSYLLSQKYHFGERWFDFTLEQQDKIVCDLLLESAPDKLKNRAIAKWGVAEEQAVALAELPDTKFESGTARFCTKALYKLIDIIADQGLSVTEAIAEIRGGYGHNRRGETELKYYGEVMPDSVVPQPKSTVEEEKIYGKINNPTVHIGLNQLRKLVNEIIKDSELGLPDEIVIELARDLKLGKEAKKKLNEQNSKNEKLNKEAKDKIEEQGYSANSENILRYKLWKELNPDDCNDRNSPYSGKKISISVLFTHQVEIEHILPLSRTLDNSYNNKTLCFTDENRMKGNASPYEACAKRLWPFDHEEILDRVARFPRKKRYRFEEVAMERWTGEDGNKFIARQLTDTQYLSKVAKRYLESLYPDDGKIHVRVISGQLTAKLRRQWGLDSILSGDNNHEKNREDHRHHAIDAVVIACTDQGLLQRAAKASEHSKELEFSVPFGTADEFRNQVKENIQKTTVSHRPDHGWQGQLLQAGNYGVARNEGFHIEYRANLISEFEDMKFEKIKNKIIKIINPNLQKILEKILNESSTSSEFIEKLKFFIDSSTYWKKVKKVRFQDSKANAITLYHPKQTQVYKKMVIPQEKLLVSFWESNSSNDPIIIIRNRMEIGRLLQQEEDRRKKKNNKNTHKIHVCEAIKNDLVTKKIIHPTAKLLLTLYKKDLIKANLGDGEKVYRISAIHEASPNERFVLREHNEAQAKDKYLKFKYVYLPEYRVRKIHITPAGRIYDSGAIF